MRKAFSISLVIVALLFSVRTCAAEEQKLELYVETGHTDSGAGFVHSPDGRLLFWANQDATAKSWDVESGKELHTFLGHTGFGPHLALSTKGDRVAFWGWPDNIVKLAASAKLCS